MDAYVGEIRLFAGTFAPINWALCDGSSLSIGDYQVLYSLIGVTYGGDGKSTFNVPDMRGRVPVGLGTLPSGTVALGQTGGQDMIALTQGNLPSHNHPVTASSVQASLKAPSPDVAFGTLSEPQRMYIDTSKVTGTPAPFSNKVIGDTGLNAPYAATMPQMALNYIICTKGLYPEFP